MLKEKEAELREVPEPVQPEEPEVAAYAFVHEECAILGFGHGSLGLVLRRVV